MIRSLLKKTIFILACVLFSGACFRGVSLAAANEDEQTLQMFYDEKDLAVTATRSSQNVSQVAENLTIVTAGEIEALNAHTLADVLRNIPGLQVDIEGGPGSIAIVSINGASFQQVMVVIDGVQQNSFGENAVNIGSIPVQNIKRIEIIKGPASSSWGPAMGGVINIITKEPDEDARVGGTLSASLAERGTGDYRGEITGTLDRFGYYLNVGKLISAGLIPHNAVDENNLYTKLTWDLPGKGGILFTLSYNKSFFQNGRFTDGSFTLAPQFNTEDFFSTLSLQYALGDGVELDLSGRVRTQDFRRLANAYTGLGQIHSDETVYGSTAKVIWRQHLHSMVAGMDYDHGNSGAEVVDAFLSLSRTIDKWGVFINDTLTLGPFSLSPAVRYDRTNYKGDSTSASMGITCNLTEHTLLRGYFGKGYSIPSALQDFAKEKTYSYQVGFETGDISYLLLKSTFFWNNTTDAIDTTGTSDRQVKQGIETEVRTLPLYNTSLFAGFNFVDAKSRNSGTVIPGIARYTWNLGLYYDDRRTFHGALTGHFIRWNSANDPSIAFSGKYDTFIWDVNLDKRIFTHGDNAVDIFFTGHNIFNGSQYPDGAFPNPRRWFEGGVRFKF